MVKLAMLEIDDAATECEVQVVEDDGPAMKKSKLGKFLG